MKVRQLIKNTILSSILCFACFGAALGQTTDFTYQGRFTDSSQTQPTSGIYQMQFALFDAGGNQIGATITNQTVQVTSGIFTVSLDFGANSFSGASRFLQVSVFSTTTNAYVALTPRQPVTSAPYAVKSLNANTAETANNSNNLGGIAANQYVQTNDSRLGDDRNPTAGSGFYIQNTNSTQSAANFNISGNGTTGGTLSGNVVNSATQYNIGNSRVLSVTGTNNTFTGFGAGTNNTGINNSFFGRNAGFDNTSGSQNSFFGSLAGANNTTGAENSFVGSGAGVTNTTGNLNSFFGRSAGFANTTGSSNTFVGRESGLVNTTGFFNTFVGRNAGGANTTGFQNTFFGANAGGANISSDNNTFIGFSAGNANGGCIGSNNTFVGYNAGVNCEVQQTPISNAVAIGAGASVFYSNSVVVGTPATRVYIQGDAFISRGATIYAPDNDDVGLIVYGYIDPYFKDGGDISICRSGGVIADCSSSRRYKTNILPFASGLSLINRLNPVTFDWKSSGKHDLGLVAEEVAEVEPLLVTYKNGQVEGVKYDRIGVVLLNAVKEQQAQIESLKQQIQLLKTLVCSQNPQAEICR
ncbi:MAG TPA: tail fiber domain-containing protein [Pyrinomonadaceae bacterium]|jgi:hypothetical protein